MRRSQKVSDIFASIGLVSARYRWIVIPLFLIYTFALGSRMADMQVATRGVDFIPPTDPLYTFKLEHEQQFGNGDYVIALIDSEKGVFSEAFLQKLRSYHLEIEHGVSGIDRVDSLYNARNIIGNPDELIIRDLLDPLPVSAQAIESVKNLAFSNPLLPRYFFSVDERYAAIVVKLHSFKLDEPSDDLFENGLSMESGPREMAPQSQYDKAIDEIRSITARYDSNGFEVILTGNPVFISVGQEVTGSDFGKMFVISLIVIAFFLWLAFRSVLAVVAPMTIALLSTVCSVGIMVVVSNPLLASIAAMPSFLLAVAVSGSIHLVVIYLAEISAGKDRFAAITETMSHSAFPVLMTSLTTSIGLYAFSFSDIPPAAEYGDLASIAVLNALFYILFLLPALLVILPVSRLRKNGFHRFSVMAWSSGLMNWIARFSTTHSKPICVGFLLVFALSIAQIPGISFSHDPVHWFDEESEIVIGNEIVSDNFGGAIALDLTVDFGRENSLHDPENLKVIEEITKIILDLEVDGIVSTKVASIVDIVKEVNQALNGGHSAHYTIPGNRALISQELLLFENAGSDDVKRFTDTQFSKARVLIFLPQRDLLLFNNYLRVMNREIESRYPNLDFYAVNEVALLSGFMTYFIDTMIESYLIAFAVIGVMMVVMFGWLTGAISMLPNLWPLAVTFAGMCVFGIPFELNTILLGGTLLGLAVDDTIHFFSGYKKYYSESPDPFCAVNNTLQTSGKALFVSTAILSLGFLCFTFSDISMTRNIGMIAAPTIVLALISDLFFAPALMVYINGARESATNRRQKADAGEAR